MLVSPYQTSQNFFSNFPGWSDSKSRQNIQKGSHYEIQQYDDKMPKFNNKNFFDKESTQDSTAPKPTRDVTQKKCGCLPFHKTKSKEQSLTKKQNFIKIIFKSLRKKSSKSSLSTNNLSSGDSESPISLTGTLYFSCVEDEEYQNMLDRQKCSYCYHKCHQEFNPLIPIVPKPNIVPDSYEERVLISKSLCGEWITILERSDSLNDQYVAIGLGSIKRAVMNRLAIRITSFLEESDTILHFHIHTPLGIRSMRSDLTGAEIVDNDPDAGIWTGTSRIIDYDISWFCPKKPVRALQQTRFNPKVGKVVETRCILPDPQHKIIMLFSFAMYVSSKPNKCLIANRFLRPLDV